MGLKEARKEENLRALVALRRAGRPPCWHRVALDRSG